MKASYRSWLLPMMWAACGLAHGAPDDAALLCGADRPLVHSGESVDVRAWLVGMPAATLRWRADAGQVRGDAVATWQFGPTDLPKEGSTVTATVEATVDGKPPLRCDVDVVLAERPDPAGSQTRGDPTGRAFLPRDQQPPAGYGAYSYVLFDRPVDDVQRGRHLAALAMFLWLIEPSAELAGSRDRKQINLAMIPVTGAVKLPERLSAMSEAQALAVRVLEDYDYARAQSLMADLCVKPSAGGGPYMVAFRDRVGCQRSNLLLDMSGVSPDLIPDWIRSFRTLATAERSWGSDTMARLQLGLRQVIASSYRDAAAAADDVSRRVQLLERQQ